MYSSPPSGGRLHVILCEWNKAFDKVDTTALIDALSAFGIGGNFLSTVLATFRAEFRVLGLEGFPSSSLHPPMKQASDKDAHYPHSYLSSCFHG